MITRRLRLLAAAALNESIKRERLLFDIFHRRLKHASLRATLASMLAKRFGRISHAKYRNRPCKYAKFDSWCQRSRFRTCAGDQRFCPGHGNRVAFQPFE